MTQEVNGRLERLYQVEQKVCAMMKRRHFDEQLKMYTQQRTTCYVEKDRRTDEEKLARERSNCQQATVDPKREQQAHQATRDRFNPSQDTL